MILLTSNVININAFVYYIVKFVRQKLTILDVVLFWFRRPSWECSSLYQPIAIRPDKRRSE